jgi:hypothetical protein
MLAARMARKGVYATAPAGFVTFRSLAVAAAAASVRVWRWCARVFELWDALLCCAGLQVMGVGGTMRNLVAQPAPEPRDVIYANVGLSTHRHAVRSRVAAGAALALTLLYTAVLAFLAAFSSADQLVQVCSHVGSFTTSTN